MKKKKILSIALAVFMLIGLMPQLALTAQAETEYEWQTLGNASPSGEDHAYYTSLYVYDGTPYVAYRDSGNDHKATVMKYTGSGDSGWEPVGSEGFSDGGASQLSLYVYDGTPYVAYADGANDYKATVMKYTGSVDSGWEPVGSAGFSDGGASYPSLYVYDGTPYVAYADYGDSLGGKVTVMKYEDSSWETVGSAGFSAGSASFTSLYVYDGTPYVAYSDYANDYKAAVMKYTGSVDSGWEPVGSAGFSAGRVYYTSLYVYDGTPYVAYTDYANDSTAAVMKYTENSDSGWEHVGSAGFSGGSVAYTSLYVYNGTPYVAYRDAYNGQLATVMRYEDGSWQTVGSGGFSSVDPIFNSLYVYEGTPYLAFVGATAGSPVKVMYYGAPPAAVSLSPASALTEENLGTNSLTVTLSGTTFADDTLSKANFTLNNAPSGVSVESVSYTDTATCTVNLAFDGTDFDTDVTDFSLTIAGTELDSGSDLTSDTLTITAESGWSYLGEAGFSPAAASYTSLYVYEGTTYVAYGSGLGSGNATVMKHTGSGDSGWELVGNPGFSEGCIDSPSLFVYDGIPYVAYSDCEHDQKATVMKFTGAGETGWEPVGSAGFSAGAAAPSLYVYDGILYVGFGDDSNSGKATVMKYTGNTVSGWEPVGLPGFSAGYAYPLTLQADDNGVLYVAYKDGANYNKATVMKYTGAGEAEGGTGWENVGRSSFSAGRADYTSLYVYNNTPYVAYMDYGNNYKATVMKYTGAGEAEGGTGWEPVGSVGFTEGTAMYISFYVDNDIPYVAFQDHSDSHNGRITVMKYEDGTGWEIVGSSGFSGGAPMYSPSLYVYDGTPYVAYGDPVYSGNVTVMYYETPAAAAANPVSALTEENLDMNSLTATLSGTTFVDSTLDKTNFTLNNAPTGLSVESVSYTDETHCTVNLAFDGTDFDTDVTDFSLTIAGAELASGSDLTSNTLTITATSDTAPTVTTKDASNINTTTATLGGAVTDDGEVTITKYGFYFSKDYTSQSDLVASGTKIENAGSATSFNGSLSSLASGTTYYYIAYATNSMGTSYGSVKSFETAPTYTATVSTYTDNSPATAPGAVELKQNGTTVYTATDSTTGLYTADAATGTYDVYINDEDTGADIEINGAAASVNIDYYTVAFEVSNAGTATASTISATAGGTSISSGDAVLSGKEVIITAVGAGADTYTYAWTGTGTSDETTAVLTIDSLSGAVDAICTVKGTTINSNSRIYTITATAGPGGNISSSTVRVVEGGSKLFTITAKKGYHISDVLVDGESVGAVDSYTFTNVCEKHTLEAIFAENTGMPYYMDDEGNEVFIGFAANGKYIAPDGVTVLFKENPKSFTDVSGHWAADYINFAAERELFLGTGSDAFSPDTGMTRAMFATVIGRLYERSYGMITGTGETFSDVPDGEYYSTYVRWAEENDIILGIGENQFAPDREITREEMAAILYRFVEFLEVSGEASETELSYLDSEQIDSWAIEAVKYCQKSGIILGRTNRCFAPKDAATRAEVATILERFVETIV